MKIDVLLRITNVHFEHNRPFIVAIHLIAGNFERGFTLQVPIAPARLKNSKNAGNIATSGDSVVELPH